VGLNPSKDYRENCGRAIYVTGVIDQTLVDRITPIINGLRFSSFDPITLYIDSLGGTIHCAEVIRRLITASNQDGDHCRLVTVVTGSAGSAAADLLALGDYAIAYPLLESCTMGHGKILNLQSLLKTLHHLR
jgi:ATP-dependent protease ClpP protease subunit